jgi:transposase
MYSYEAYDAWIENLIKARARRKELGAYPRPWRSKQETRAIRRAVWLWGTSEGPTCSGREIARQLGVSHTHIQNLMQQFAADPVKAMRENQAHRRPMFEELEQARQETARMREHGLLRERDKLGRSSKRRKEPQTCDPVVAKRRSLINANPDVSAEEMCEIFDRQHVPLTIEIAVGGFRTWPEAYRHPHYRKRIQVLITKEARRESKVLDFSLKPEQG